MSDNSLLIILGNQLFPIEELEKIDCQRVFMKEDLGLCTDHHHHKLKILMFLTTMREYRDYLVENGYEVIYHSIEDSVFSESYLETLSKELIKYNIKSLNYFEIEDNSFGNEFENFKKNSSITFIENESPMFLCSKTKFKSFAESKSLRMASFYQLMRKDLNILMDNGKPLGGQWSFDAENRKKLPKDISLPRKKALNESKYKNELIKTINLNFSDHPGKLENYWIPSNREDALNWLDDFLKIKLNNFGTYEDAIHSDDNFIFHSALSPILNMGLITPSEVIKKTLNYSNNNNIPINSLEGFIRQIIGWREFIRGTYHLKGEEEKNSNFFNHENRLSDHWYDGTTGIEPLDDAITDCLNYGYTHHIPRLMIISNLMTLCRIHPDDVYKWFMEMFVDSSEWVMVPNVYGMGTFADGGIFATKPYSCGSNYILKMSNYKRGDWCNVVDGLYWMFMNDNREFFQSNPRLSILPRSLDKMNSERRTMLFKEANIFIAEKTIK